MSDCDICDVHFMVDGIGRGHYLPLPSNIGEDCSNLVHKMLKVDSASRIQMEELIKHPWVRCAQIRMEDISDPEAQGDIGVRVLDSHMSGLFTKNETSKPPIVQQSMEALEDVEGQENVGKSDEGIHESVKLVLSDWEGKGTSLTPCAIFLCMWLVLVQ